jgi:mRNA interferase MazF
MTTYKAGDVVLLRFPFTDLKSVKKRPAVIVSPDDFSVRYGDVVVLALTSKDQDDEALRLADWRAVGLLKGTWIKPLLGTLSSDLVEKKLGELSLGDGNRVSAVIKRMVAGKYLGK